MRNIINISLPAEMTMVVEKEIKRHSFASKSEFFRHLLREYLKRQAVDDVNVSRKEYASGKAKTLKSVKALWN